jgi:hypothetical protein
LRLFAARRENQDRNAGPVAQVADHIDVIAIGRAQIEDNQIGLPRPGLNQTMLGILGLSHPES